MPTCTRNTDRLRIAVGGLAITYPFGGMFWHYLQFVLGLQALGHDVLYVEDIGRWSYDPVKRTYVESGEKNAALFAQHVRRVDSHPEPSWMFRDAAGVVHGCNWPEAEDFCKNADVFINLSMSHDMTGAYGGADCKVLIDTDPLYTQALLATGNDTAANEDYERITRILGCHDVFFTFGLNVGNDDCLVPTGDINWNPIVQPIILEYFEAARRPVNDRARKLTTVASWEPAEALTRVGDVLYGGKSREFESILDLPGQSALPLELALSGQNAPVELLERHGWKIIDSNNVSVDPWKYQSYLADSFGEFSVAKHAYVASRSGWFSDRSACYLSLGVPVILQDTGFSRVLPTGRGLFSFTNIDEAAAAIDDLVAEPEKHAEASLEIAHSYFRAEKVMSNLLKVVGANV